MASPQGPESGADVAAPTCYRHPNRETYVSCVRCGRHACPDCLRSAAVGQQCVECVREGNRGSRQAVGRFGGKVSQTPVVTYTIVALCVLAYLIELTNSTKVLLNGGMFGYNVALGQWYRLITSAFLHEPPNNGLGLTHILFNMWALIVIGPPLERTLGRTKFIALYLVSALAGSVLLYLINPFELAIGASGAIFGLFGGFLVLAKRLQLDMRQIVVLIVINLAITFFVHGIAWQDHVGGLIAGILLTAAYVYAPRANRTLIQVGATVVMLALVVAGVVIKDLSLVHSVRF
ncbi:MAG TPA: rhomboid family intramembrane serine protease [Streptosporangiaceae bacterium]|jgi:membrane associated rhomboid family serine protease|nr:rhomboid family intramembrane serine protease [Streptosporangiaceae bacterium]